MEYRVELTDHDPLPGRAWAMVRTPREVICFIARASITAQVLAEAWEGYRMLIEQAPPSLLAVV